jgi:hypothetical protein
MKNRKNARDKNKREKRNKDFLEVHRQSKPPEYYKIKIKISIKFGILIRQNKVNIKEEIKVIHHLSINT